MPHNRYDIVAIGNAIVDVLAATDDQFLSEKNITKGSMQLIDADSAETLYQEMNPSHEISGGSAANTLVGVAALGGRCAFIGQVANDPLGQVFNKIFALRIFILMCPFRKQLFQQGDALF